MPFKSEKQRKWMHANEPKMAKKWEKEESVNEAMSESQRFKVYNSLKKGDIVSIKYDSSIQKGTKYIPYVVTKGKTKLMKGKIERIILKSPKNPRFKAYLYNRDGDVSLALGDMAASIVDMKKGKVKESVDERKYNHKKTGDDYLGGFNSSKGDTEMFADKKGKYYLWVKPKGKKAKYIDLPKRIKNRSDADNFHDKIKKSMGESVDERLKKGQKIIALNPKDKTLKGKVGVIYSVGIGKSTSYVVQVGKGKKARFAIMTDKEIKLKESVDERIPAGEQKLVYQFKKLSTSQMDELDAMFARAGINGVPDFNKKTWSTYANRDTMKLKKNKTLQKFIKLKGGQQIKEGFGGELKGSEKKKFENDRKKNGEQLGYTLTGESDVKETLRRVVKEEVSNIISERMDKRQAGETLKQLGGNKFIAMTGAKNFAVGPKGMGFKIGRNSKSINYVRIDLKSNDLYDMEFIRLRKSQIKVVKRVTGVYNDQLQKMFTKYTGMYTSL